MPHEIDIQIGKKFDCLRQIRGLSQAKLGEKIGVKFQQVQKYETGVNRISCSRLWMISRALEQPLASLFEKLEHDAETIKSGSRKSIVLHFGSAEVDRLQREFLKPPPVKRRAVMKLVKSIAAPEAHGWQ
jgi:transcriptional regulator with XRE-family HTH domain